MENAMRLHLVRALVGFSARSRLIRARLGVEEMEPRTLLSVPELSVPHADAALAVHHAQVHHTHLVHHAQGHHTHAPGRIRAMDDPIVFDPIETDDSGEQMVAPYSDTPNTGDIIGQVEASPSNPDQSPITYSGSSADLTVLPDGEVEVTNGPGVEQLDAQGSTENLTVTATGADGSTAVATVSLYGIITWTSQPTIYLQASDGTVWYPGDTNDLLNDLTWMSQNNLTIATLQIRAHGGPAGIELDLTPPSGNWLNCDGTKIEVAYNDETPLFRSVTGPGTTINLVGCYTKDLARNIMTVLNNGTTAWGTVRYSIGIPGTAHGFGIFSN
jgi:hypothetical protein